MKNLTVVILQTAEKGRFARVLSSKWLAKGIQQLKEHLGVKEADGIGFTIMSAISTDLVLESTLYGCCSISSLLNLLHEIIHNITHTGICNN